MERGQFIWILGVLSVFLVANCSAAPTGNVLDAILESVRSIDRYLRGSDKATTILLKPQRERMITKPQVFRTRDVVIDLDSIDDVRVRELLNNGVRGSRSASSANSNSNDNKNVNKVKSMGRPKVPKRSSGLDALIKELDKSGGRVRSGRTSANDGSGGSKRKTKRPSKRNDDDDDESEDDDDDADNGNANSNSNVNSNVNSNSNNNSNKKRKKPNLSYGARSFSRGRARDNNRNVNSNTNVNTNKNSNRMDNDDD